MADKYTDKIGDIELAADPQDAQLSRIVELFKFTYEGFAIMQKQIEAISPTTASATETKLQMMQQNIDTKLQDLSTQLVATNSKVLALDAAARQIDATVQQISQGSYSGSQQTQAKVKGILEHKVIQNMKPLTGDKGKFRQWHQQFVNAITQVNQDHGEAIKRMEEVLDTGTRIEDARIILDTEFQLTELVKDLYSIIVEKSEGEAWDKIKAIPGRDGV